MKILYGVQATGNGHITRAAAMAKALRTAAFEVDYLFSGRPCDRLFNMEQFGDFRCLPGLTFALRRGRIDTLATLTRARPLRYLFDLLALDLAAYDLVITDFEPLCAWAARRHGKPVLGIGHQYAFHYPVPVAPGAHLTAKWILRHFAPADWALGIHWHHFDSPILPPLIEPLAFAAREEAEKILVYLPFEDRERLAAWLRQHPGHEFHCYCDVSAESVQGNLRFKPFSRGNFHGDLASCNGVIANAGFSLASEALQYGKKLLVKPLAGHFEQLSNAAALLQLGRAEVVEDFRSDSLGAWLQRPNPDPQVYPDVAGRIVDWIKTGMKGDIHSLARAVWAEVSP